MLRQFILPTDSKWVETKAQRSNLPKVTELCWSGTQTQECLTSEPELTFIHLSRISVLN